MKRLALLLLLSVGGCVQYYRVTDPQSGKSYITSNFHARQNYYTGSAAIVDLKSGKTVILQQYEYEPIMKEEAELEMGTGGTKKVK